MEVGRLSVLMPTLNVMPFLREHIDRMLPWLDLVDELIVVDSHSTDGTVELIRDALRDVPIRIELHPPGLYQSWNHGISLARGRWLYVSTVGDSIEREQLLHLIEVAEASESDAVISEPTYVDAGGKPLPGQGWAVAELNAEVAFDAPRVLSHGAALFYAVRYLHRSALLGSSASNLYRTAHLQAHPFPLDFGPAGDLAWSVVNALRARHAVTPRIGSTFRIHDKAYAAPKIAVGDFASWLREAALRTATSNAEREDLQALDLHELVALERAVKQRYDELKLARRRCRPWFLHAEAWRARGRSKRARIDLREAEQRMIRAVRERFSEPIALPSAPPAQR